MNPLNVGIIDYEGADQWEATVHRLERGQGLPDLQEPPAAEPDTVFVAVDAVTRYVYDGRVISLDPPGGFVDLAAAEALGLV